MGVAVVGGDGFAVVGGAVTGGLVTGGLVTGGVGVKAAYMPTWGGTTKAVSRLIRNTR